MFCRISVLIRIMPLHFPLTAKDCGALAVPLNGSITIRETTFPNEASFSCDEGFLLNGSTVRRCQADGSWSGIATSCEGKIAFQNTPRSYNQSKPS